MIKQKDADTQLHLNFNVIYLATAFVWKGIITKHNVVLHQRGSLVIFLLVVFHQPSRSIAMHCFASFFALQNKLGGVCKTHGFSKIELHASQRIKEVPQHVSLLPI